MRTIYLQIKDPGLDQVIKEKAAKNSDDNNRDKVLSENIQNMDCDIDSESDL